MAIKPLELPSAAGLDYGKGDVRHFSQGDDMSSVALANASRNLAQRDNIIKEKVNEVVEIVNNREQFVPLPVSRTTLPPNDDAVVLNYRIPAGFESRILNATIAATPISSDIELNIYYNDSYGGSTGTSVVSTTTEFTGGVQFYQEGEFIVSIKNKGGLTLDIAASVMLTIRPIGAQGTLLVGTVIVGPKGQVGRTGPKGQAGPPGTGGAGSPGMIWRDGWTNGASYGNNDVVHFSYSGTYGSWICRVPHVASVGVNDPQVDATTWNPVAYGVTGNTGDIGASGSTTSAHPTYSIVHLTGSSAGPITPYLRYGATYTAGVSDGDYVGTGSSGTNLGLTFHQVTVESGTVASPQGLAFLRHQRRMVFNGTIQIFLPQSIDGARVDWDTSMVACTTTVDQDGTDAGANACKVSQDLGLKSYTLVMETATPRKVAINCLGFTTI